MKTHIQKLLPILCYENKLLISKDGDLTKAYILELPEAYNLDSKGYSYLHEILVKAVSVLPDNTIIHKQDIFYKSNYQSKIYENQLQLDRSYELHFNEREFFAHKCYLFITKCTEERLNSRSNFSTLCRKNIIPAEVNSAGTALFTEAVQNFKSILECAVRINEVSDTELLGSVDSSGIIEQITSLDFGNKDYTITKDIEYNKRTRSLVIGHENLFFHTISSNNMMPQTISPCRPVQKYSTDVSSMVLSFASPLGIGCHCNHIYNQYLFIPNREKTLQKLESDLKNMTSLSRYSRSNRVHAEQQEKFLNDVYKTGECIVKSHFNINTWASSENEIRDIRNILSPCISSMGLSVHQATIETPLLYWASIPGNEGDFPSEESFYGRLSPMACMFTGETSYKSTPSDFGIKLSDRDSGKPVIVDFSDLPMKKGIISNRNKFVLGPSGSGKSFFMNHMLRGYYSQGASIVLIDMGNSYEGLSNFIRSESEGKDGSYITCTDQNQLSFNPFCRGENSFDDETVNNLKALLTTLWKKEDEAVTMMEENFLADMVDRYLSRESSKGSFNGFYRYIQKCMPKESTRKALAEDLLMVLSPYYEGGRYEKLLNSTSITAESLLNDRFVVFEIDSIKDNPILMTVTSIVIMELFITKMKQLKGIRKMFVIEEAWRALATKRMASYIKYLYKTIRKYYGEAIIVTQEVDDVLSSPIVKESIINNSDCRILMDESRYLNKFSEIQKTLGITEKQKAEILSINRANNPKRPKYNELWVGLGSRLSKVYSLEVSQEEYYTYTTEETEKKQVAELAKELGNYCKAIEIISNR